MHDSYLIIMNIIIIVPTLQSRLSILKATTRKSPVAEVSDT